MDRSLLENQFGSKEYAKEDNLEGVIILKLNSRQTFFTNQDIVRISAPASKMGQIKK